MGLSYAIYGVLRNEVTREALTEVFTFLCGRIIRKKSE